MDVETRDKKIIEMRNGGHTLQSIANEIGVTRERVRQILAYHGQRTLTRDERVARVAQAWRATGEIRDPLDVAREHGLPPTQRNITDLRRAVPELTSPQRRGGFSQFNFDDMAAAVRACADRLGVDPKTEWLTITTYNSNRIPGEPSSALIASRHKWRDVMVAAGFDVGNLPSRGIRNRAHWDKQVSDESVELAVEAFRAYARATGAALTTAAFEEFLASRDDLPSLSTVRNRLRHHGVVALADILAI